MSWRLYVYASILVLTWDCGIPSPSSSTRLNYLPLSLSNLRLDALWIDGSQVSTVWHPETNLHSCVHVLATPAGNLREWAVEMSHVCMPCACALFLSFLPLPHPHSQPQPLIALHVESDPNNSEKKRLTCSFLPQQGPHSPSLGEWQH